MDKIFRIKTVLGGFPGSPGVNTHYFTAGLTPVAIDLQEAANEVSGMMSAVKAYLVNGLTWSIDPEVHIYEIATGTLTSVAAIDATGLAGNSSAVAGSTSRASMIKVRFSTDTVVNNRRLRGGIYLGPISDAAVSTAGNISAACATAVASGYAALTSGVGPKLQVWHRPKNRAGGVAADVDLVSVMPVPAVLRSRRD
jgi:hypothetical protein